MIDKFGIENMLKEAENTLRDKHYFPAFTLSLALVSCCANIEYPDEWFDKNAQESQYLKDHFPKHFKDGKYKCRQHDQERFTMWIDSIIKESQQPADENIPDIYIDGELLYKMRCNIFHEAIIDLTNEKLSHEPNNLLKRENMIIVFNEDPEICISDFSFVSISKTSLDDNTETQIDVEFDISGYTNFLLHLVKVYYKKNTSKFNNKFFNVKHKQ